VRFLCVSELWRILRTARQNGTRFRARAALFSRPSERARFPGQTLPCVTLFQVLLLLLPQFLVVSGVSLRLVSYVPQLPHGLWCFPEFEIDAFSRMNQFEYPGSLRAACKLACRHLHHNQPEWEQLESSARQTEQHRPNWSLTFESLWLDFRSSTCYEVVVKLFEANPKCANLTWKSTKAIHDANLQRSRPVLPLRTNFTSIHIISVIYLRNCTTLCTLLNPLLQLQHQLSKALERVRHWPR
jgi:hypothetical protein